jgi:chemotaxis protein CheC
MDTGIRLSAEQKKTLKKITTIGMANANRSLSKMMDNKVSVEMSTVEFLPLEDVPKRLGGSDVLSMGIYLRMLGDLGGTSLMVLSRESALALVDTLYGYRIGTTQVLSQEDRSALGEIGNVLTASCLTELGNILGVMLYHTPPCVVFDVASSLLGFVLRGMDTRINDVLVAQITFRGGKGVIRGDFLFLMDSSSLSVLINKIEKKLHPGT